MKKISLPDFFISHNYQQVPLRKLSTGHLVITARINNIPGLFILDSGAGATVIDKRNSKLFQLQLTIDSLTGAGAGGSGLTVYSAANNKLQINDFYLDSFKISVMNLEHVNSGLQQFGVTDTIHGVIGADLLEQGNAVIDYAGRYLYLKTG